MTPRGVIPFFSSEAAISNIAGGTAGSGWPSKAANGGLEEGVGLPRSNQTVLRMDRISFWKARLRIITKVANTPTDMAISQGGGSCRMRPRS